MICFLLFIFLTAFTKLQTFKGEVTFGAWLKRIVINKSIVEGMTKHEGKKGSKYTFGSKLVTQKSPGKV